MYGRRRSACTFPTLRQVVPWSVERFRLAIGLVEPAVDVGQSKYPVGLLASYTGWVGAMLTALPSTSPAWNWS